jgi:hypothetical protein
MWISREIGSIAGCEGLPPQTHVLDNAIRRSIGPLLLRAFDGRLLLWLRLVASAEQEQCRNCDPVAHDILPLFIPL